MCSKGEKGVAIFQILLTKSASIDRRISTNSYENSNGLTVMLAIVISVQDLASGLAFSLFGSIDFSFTCNLEFIMKTNLITVLQAVKSECASLMGVKAPGR